ncbi:hypothetical protein NN561_016809 [Cricetulus griseus]
MQGRPWAWRSFGQSGMHAPRHQPPSRAEAFPLSPTGNSRGIRRLDSRERGTQLPLVSGFRGARARLGDPRLCGARPAVGRSRCPVRGPGCAQGRAPLVKRGPAGRQAAWGTTDSLRGEGGGPGPSRSGDVRGSRGRGLQRDVAASPSGSRLRAAVRLTRPLVPTEECACLSEARVLGGRSGRVPPGFGSPVLRVPSGFHLVLVPCAKQRRGTSQGPSLVPASLPSETHSSISAVDTRHLCVLLKEIL